MTTSSSKWNQFIISQVSIDLSIDCDLLSSTLNNSTYKNSTQFTSYKDYKINIMSCDNVSEKKNYFNEDVNFRNNYKYSHSLYGTQVVIKLRKLQ